MIGLPPARRRLISHGCGFLVERGIRLGTGRNFIQQELSKLAAESAADLSPRMLLLVTDITSELKVN